MARDAQPGIPWGQLATFVGLTAIVLLALPFVSHSLRFGAEGLSGELAEPTHLHVPGRWLSNAAIFAHMIGGAVITVLAPVQLVGAIRRRVPRLHHAFGYVFLVAALTSGFGGLVYIALNGTIGGRLMDVAFAGYGICVVVAAIQTVRHARARRLEQHRAWALRLFVLAIGSWIYRMHYTLWYMLTDGLASEKDFSGLFDQIQVFAFYVPYLLAVELCLRLGRRPSARRIA